MSPILVITGMHRSGTSLTASLLQSAGLYIGKSLIGEGEGNNKGHFEDFNFFRFHENVLKAQAIHKAGWTLQKKINIEEGFLEIAQNLILESTQAQAWGWKDPRTTLFLNFWADLLPEANFLFIYRAPWEVIDSLYRRSSEPDRPILLQPNLAPKIWVRYNENILEFYANHESKCLLINIETVTKHNQVWIDQINQKFQLDLKHPAPSIYEPALLRQPQSNQYPSLLQTYFPSTLELYEQLETNAWRPEGENIDISWKKQISPINSQECAFQDWACLRKIEKEQETLKAQLKQLQTEKDQLAQKHQQLQTERDQLVQKNQHLQSEVQRLQQQPSPPVEASPTES